jgi:hypothetical protein
LATKNTKTRRRNIPISASEKPAADRVGDSVSDELTPPSNATASLRSTGLDELRLASAKAARPLRSIVTFA